MNHESAVFLFLLAALVLVAPHLSEFEAKSYSLVCLFVALIFFIIDIKNGE